MPGVCPSLVKSKRSSTRTDNFGTGIKISKDVFESNVCDVSLVDFYERINS